MNLLKFYKLTVSQLLERFFGKGCRYFPTCSEYAAEAIETHGGLRGSTMALKRVLSCHPLGGAGFDPVPKKEEN